MEPATVAIAASSVCSHCGLPAGVAGPAEGDRVFCCHGCRLVARIVGRQEQGGQAWDLLRLGVGAILAMNIMMVSLLLYADAVETQAVPVFRFLLLALAAPALTILAAPQARCALREVAAGKPGLDTLISGGAVSAFAVSAANVLRGQGEIYFDTATMLPLLVTFGRMLEASAKTRASDLLRTLEALLPETALRVGPAGCREVPLDQLRRGDRVRVRPGERVAVDGVIREGGTVVEEAPFTGEFLPRACGVGDRVHAGTVNGAGTIEVEAERTGGEILLHRVVAQVSAAWQTPSRSERTAQRVAARFIPAVMLTAAASLLFWWWWGDSSRGWLSALSVLVVSCPCTLGIATPLVTSLAIARAARDGIVVRGGDVMEQVGMTAAVFFDKTGTVTTPCPEVKEVVALDPLVSADELLGRLAVLESASEHAIARGVAQEARSRRLAGGTVRDVTVVPGCGLRGLVTWQGVAEEVVAGSARFVQQGETGMTGSAVRVAWGGRLRGEIILSETVRPDAACCIRQLHALGVATALLSGDRHSAAAAIAGVVGIARVEAPRLPEEKLACLRGARAAGQVVAMVGDGINDAPALAAADTGIAVGGSIDLVRLAGHVVILSDRLSQVPWLMALSRRCGSIVRQNFAWSFGYNAVGIAAAAAGVLDPLVAALAMVVSSLTVLGNSLRIRYFPGVELGHAGPSPQESSWRPAAQWFSRRWRKRMS